MFDSKLKKELAEAKRQLAQANEIAATNYNSALFYQRRVKELETQAQADEKAKGDAELALRQARKEMAALQAGLAQLAGAVNGKDCDYTTKLSAQALEDIVSAHHNRRRASRP
jgi:chromosome segregation ATPase